MGTFTNADLEYLPYFRLMAGRKPHDQFRSNGSSFSPDVVFGIDIRPAAHFHDYAYSGETPALHNEADRYRQDQLFRLNLTACGLYRLAWLYYFRVRMWGHYSYCYSPGLEPKRTLRFWLRLFFSRYLEW